ncbi:LysR family transcriptional regulator [Taklimakanibacter deserti]|uniref:LysR family transcriptional regulator n=1 Tax=Taklimakanibacter deserti TaxID=2267839 RepID=UPI000E64B26D
MQANPTLDQLQVLLAVAETGSFSAAGRKLNRAQSVISYTIANLEAQLGVKLFEREGTREPQLTEMGKAVLEDARRMSGVLQRIRSRVEHHARGLESEVALSIDVTLPAPVLIAVLKAFEAKFPTVTLRLSVGTLGLIVDQVVKGEADIGVGGITDADVRLIEIGDVTLVPVAAPDHPLARLKRTVAQEELRDHVQLVVIDQSRRTAGKDFGVFAYRTWRLTDMHTKHLMLRSGVGWGSLPPWMIADDLAQGRLVELELESFSKARGPLYAMHRNDRNPGPAASWLIGEFKQHLGCFNEYAPDEVLAKEHSPLAAR